MSKLFEIVTWKILLDKLKYYGIFGIMLRLLESYLTERKKLVDFAEYVSTCKSVEVRVPQGLVLELLLFEIYTISF